VRRLTGAADAIRVSASARIFGASIPLRQISIVLARPCAAGSG
jgi:hypothetical protein